MTGRQFCQLLEIDYDAIVQARLVDCADNVEFFLLELTKIKGIKRRLLDLLNG